MQLYVRLELEDIARARMGMSPRKTGKPKNEQPADFGLLMPPEEAVEDFNVWIESGRVVMAVGGGWWDQPEEWRHAMMALQHEYSEIVGKLTQTKGGPISHLPPKSKTRKRPPKFEDAIGGKKDG